VLTYLLFKDPLPRHNDLSESVGVIGILGAALFFVIIFQIALLLGVRFSVRWSLKGYPDS
jgi:hypothetical protein